MNSGTVPRIKEVKYKEESLRTKQQDNQSSAQANLTSAGDMAEEPDIISI